MTLHNDKPFSDYVAELNASLDSPSEARFAAEQLMTLHKYASSLQNTTLLELGVDRGQSTKVLLNAIYGKANSQLVSVDILDCSAVANCDNWIFVNESSVNTENIIRQAPILNKGIDLLYIDSLHTPEHVRNEIYSWFPYLNPGCHIFFDDVDSGPYMQGQRKDNFQIESSNRDILRLITSVFRSNLDILDFQMFYGSTGLACLTKRCDRSVKLRDPRFLKDRHFNMFTRLLNKFSLGTKYNHSSDSPDSFLIDVTSFKS